MRIKITGDMRDIANSAWISTLNEVSAKARSDEDVERVVRFLVENNHTSPLESVSISFILDSASDLNESEKYLNNLFVRNDLVEEGDGRHTQSFTVDLLNFVKITSRNKLFDKTPWQLFAKERPLLSEISSKLPELGEKILTFDNVAEKLGNHGMSVELINYHNGGSRKLSRATWRVKCPLSVGVQILRHRMGSYNMVSGRYKTIRQELIPAVDDCAEIFDKSGYNLNEYLSSVDNIITQYNKLMKEARQAKLNNKISNDEYKRLREFSRFILPEGRMTELYITYYLDDFYNNYLPLRDSVHAQMEHVWIAQEMRRVLEENGADQ